MVEFEVTLSHFQMIVQLWDKTLANIESQVMVLNAPFWNNICPTLKWMVFKLQHFVLCNNFLLHNDVNFDFTSILYQWNVVYFKYIKKLLRQRHFGSPKYQGFQSKNITFSKNYWTRLAQQVYQWQSNCFLFSHWWRNST